MIGVHADRGLRSFRTFQKCGRILLRARRYYLQVRRLAMNLSVQVLFEGSTRKVFR